MGIEQRESTPALVNYRAAAFAAYEPICAHCGFGVRAVLEVAHLDGNRQNNAIENLVILCPNCHKMHDLGLIPTHVIIEMRNERREPNWAKRMKDAGRKAALTRKRRAVALRRKRCKAARKAVETRRRNVNGEG